MGISLFGRICGHGQQLVKAFILILALGANAHAQQQDSDDAKMQMYLGAGMSAAGAGIAAASAMKESGWTAGAYWASAVIMAGSAVYQVYQATQLKNSEVEVPKMPNLPDLSNLVQPYTPPDLCAKMPKAFGCQGFDGNDPLGGNGNINDARTSINEALNSGEPLTDANGNAVDPSTLQDALDALAALEAGDWEALGKVIDKNGSGLGLGSGSSTATESTVDSGDSGGGMADSIDKKSNMAADGKSVKGPIKPFNGLDLADADGDFLSIWQRARRRLLGLKSFPAPEDESAKRGYMLARAELIRSRAKKFAMNRPAQLATSAKPEANRKPAAAPLAPAKVKAEPTRQLK